VPPVDPQVDVQRHIMIEPHQQMLAVRVRLHRHPPVQPRRPLGETALRTRRGDAAAAEHPLMLGGQTMNGVSLRHARSIARPTAAAPPPHAYAAKPPGTTPPAPSPRTAPRPPRSAPAPAAAAAAGCTAARPGTDGARSGSSARP